MSITIGGGPLGSAGGGSTSPGGSTTQVQFNDGGAFGGESAFNYTKATDTLAVPTYTGSNVTLTGLATPAITSVTPQGTPGATAYSYKVVARLADGTSTAASAAGSTATGNATLDAVNYNTVLWGAVTGAVDYKLYRTAGGAAPPKLIYTGALLTFDDIGAAGTAETPAIQANFGFSLVGAGTNLFSAYRVGTPTDANFERFGAYWSSTTFYLDMMAGGTGTVRPLSIRSTSNIGLVGGGVTVNLGASGLYPGTSDATPLGAAGNQYSTLYLSRAILGSKTTTLTETTDTNAIDVAVANNTRVSGEVIYEVYASDATDYQVLSGTVRYSAVNKGGTVTASISEVGSQTTALSAGTLTASNTVLTGANKITIRCNATSSLTQTTLEIRWRVVSVSTAAITPA